MKATITYYRPDPATISAVTCTSTGDADRLRRVLERAIELSGRDIWVWKPGALVSMHADTDGIRCAWRDSRAMVKYSRYIDSAWTAVAGDQSDIEHVIAECHPAPTGDHASVGAGVAP
jgi:hypothetical protein